MSNKSVAVIKASRRAPLIRQLLNRKGSKRVNIPIPRAREHHFLIQKANRRRGFDDGAVHGLAGFLGAFLDNLTSSRV